MCVCVCSAIRQVQSFNRLSMAHILKLASSLSFLTEPNNPILFRSGGLLPSILPSIAIVSRSPCLNVCPVHLLCLFLMMSSTWCLSPTRRSTSSLETLSAHGMPCNFHQSYILQLSKLMASSFLISQGQLHKVVYSKLMT